MSPDPSHQVYQQVVLGDAMVSPGIIVKGPFTRHFMACEPVPPLPITLMLSCRAYILGPNEPPGGIP